MIAPSDASNRAVNERREPADATTRCFFLAEPPHAGRARLLEEDEQHAARVLRLSTGDALTGLDGRGGRWPLLVTAVRKATLELEVTAEPTLEPEPGAEGAPLPWIELAIAFPKGGRADDMLDHVVQLGVAAITPLIAERSQGFDAERVEHRHERWMRIARAACKQARRAWLPTIGEARSVRALLAAHPAQANVLLHPKAASKLELVLRQVPWTVRERPLRLLVGPEGGWTDEEALELARCGALPAALAPHVLRIETAAEAALAVTVSALWRR